MGAATERLKKRMYSLGADLVGVAPVERFEGALVHPCDLLRGARSVVVLGLRVPLASVKAWGRVKKSYQLYGHGWLNFHLSYLEYNLVQLLEDEGYLALPLSSIDPRYDMDSFSGEALSHRHAAVAAGLGEFGWNNLFLSVRFGPRVRLTSTVTTALLAPDPPYEGKPLCSGRKCLKCAEACPMGILSGDSVRFTVAGKTYEMARLGFEEKYLCRWCQHGLTQLGGALTEIPLPEKKTTDAYLEAWDSRDKHQKRQQDVWGGLFFCGRCVHVCPVGVSWRVRSQGLQHVTGESGPTDSC